METEYFKLKVKWAQVFASFCFYIMNKYIIGCHAHFTSGLQDKSVPWKKDMKLFDAWKGVCHYISCNKNH